MRDVNRVVDRQDDHRHAEAHSRGDCGCIGQHHHGVEAENVVQSIFSYPQISEPESLGALRDPAHHCHVDWIGRAVGQCNAKGDGVSQGHMQSDPI